MILYEQNCETSLMLCSRLEEVLITELNYTVKLENQSQYVALKMRHPLFKGDL